jgi:hypothetical protein
MEMSGTEVIIAVAMLVVPVATFLFFMARA